MRTHPEPKWMLWLEWAILIAIITLAAYLRYWRIEEVPPGFNSDEAVGAMGALLTLREGLQYSYPGQGGGGALGFYFATAAFYLFGPSIATMRGLAAWAGLVGLFANYWAVREVFKGSTHRAIVNNEPMNNSQFSILNSQFIILLRARAIAALSTLLLAVSLWHISTSRIAFAGIGVPFLLLPSVYFLWLGLNRLQITNNRVRNLKSYWPFAISGIFLGGLMYIYLSGVFVPPFYAIYFVAQWLLVAAARKLSPQHDPGKSRFWRLSPPTSFLTTHFWGLFTTGLVAALLLLPMVYVLLFRPDLEPGTTRVSQAFFMNPQINQGDPWGLLWRSIVGNVGAYGVSLSWFIGQSPKLALPFAIGLMVFLGFLITLWRSLRGSASYLFVLLWYFVLLLPSILSPDIIPHNLRTIGATTPTYVFAAIFIVWLFETVWAAGRRWAQPRLGRRFVWLAGGLSLALAAALIWIVGQATMTSLYQYFYLYPQTKDAKASFHVYAIEMAQEIKHDPRPEVAFILPRNTAAGEVYPNYTIDFLTELKQAPAGHYWVVDKEETVPADLTAAAAQHTILRLVKWKASKHTGADPKGVIPYYLEKYGHYERADEHEYFDIKTYHLDAAAPNFSAAETLQPAAADFGGQLRLAGYALGNAGDVAHLTDPQAASNDLLWLRLAWQKTANQPENLKVSALLYDDAGQLVIQADKQLLNNFFQVGSRDWPVGAQETTYFLLPIPPATPPGRYNLKLAVYGEESQTRLLVKNDDVLSLAEVTILPARQPLDPATLKLALGINQELTSGLTLLGFETLPGEAVRSGQRVSAALIWQAGRTPPPTDLAMSLTVKPAEGDEEMPLSEPVGLAGSYVTSRWQPGEVLRGWLSARIPPQWEPGIYKLRLRLSPSDKPGQEVMTLPIGEFKVEGWPRNFNAPQPQVKLGANFNNGQASLVGLEASAPQAAPGDTLKVRLYWQAGSEFDRDYTAFVHLVGPDGQLHGQVDQTPGVGAYPTTGWLSGEFIADDYAIIIPADAPPGDYHLEIGMYDPASGQRLKVNQQDDKVLAPGLKVQ